MSTTISTLSVNVYEDMLKRISEKLTEDLVDAQAKQTKSILASARETEILVMNAMNEAKTSTTQLAIPTPVPIVLPNNAPPPAPPTMP
jgi:hypothetical protein